MALQYYVQFVMHGETEPEHYSGVLEVQHALRGSVLEIAALEEAIAEGCDADARQIRLIAYARLH